MWVNGESMKDRITLLFILCFLFAFLIVFQNYFNTALAIIFLVLFMSLYMIYMFIAVKHQKRALLKNPPCYDEKLSPFISILIPCHNESNVIENTVKNILEVDYTNYEVIVIDDRSTDDTKDTVLELEKRYDKVIALIRNKDAYPGKSAVLNDAVKIAKGEAYLVFDADAKIKPDFIKKILVQYDSQDVGAIQARKIIINANQNFLTTCQYNEYVMDTHLQVGRDAVKGAVELRGKNS